MATRPDKAESPYNLEPRFERAVVTLCARSPRFWARVGQHMVADGLGSDVAKLALKAARAIALDAGGRGPDTPLLVLQRLRRWVDDGKVKLSDVGAVSDMFDEAEDAGLPREDDAAEEIVPVLRQRARNTVVRTAMDEMSKDDSNLERTAREIRRAQTIGDDVTTSVGVRLGRGSFEEMEKLKHLDRLPLGIDELDIELDGGMPRGCLGIILGGPGGGKSMALGHIGARSIKSGLFAAYATLEVPVPTVLARVKANLTGVPINAILEDSTRCAAILAQIPLGPFYVQEFTPLVSTMEDIEEWVNELERTEGRRLDVLLTDYGDKLGSPKTAGREGESGYGSGRVVFERARVFAHERKLWHWTGSQATRGKENKRKRIGLDDVADSMHKVRVADLVVSSNVDEEQRSISWFVAKNRHGESGAMKGPLPHDFACGRVAPVFDTPGNYAMAMDSLGMLTRGARGGGP